MVSGANVTSCTNHWQSPPSKTGGDLGARGQYRPSLVSTKLPILAPDMHTGPWGRAAFSVNIASFFPYFGTGRVAIRP